MKSLLRILSKGMTGFAFIKITLPAVGENSLNVGMRKCGQVKGDEKGLLLDSDLSHWVDAGVIHYHRDIRRESGWEGKKRTQD